MKQRINIVLPGSLIEQAVQHFISHKSAESVRARLEQTAVRYREIAGDWLAAGAGKSTSRRSTRQ